MIQARIFLKDGAEHVAPFVPSTLGMLLAQVDMGMEEDWDLGGEALINTRDVEIVEVEGL